MLLLNRSKINIYTNCFAELLYLSDRCENSILARRKSRNNCIFVKPTTVKHGNYKSVFMDLQIDVSGYWYIGVREKLLKLGAKISSIDPGLFYWRENNTLYWYFRMSH